MRNRYKITLLVQAALVLAMSGAVSSTLYGYLGLWALAVFGGLIIIGAATIIFPKIGAFPFSLLTLLASLVPIITHSVLDIGVSSYRGIYDKAMPMYEETAPVVSFPVVLAVGLFLVSGYIALSVLNSLDRDYRKIETDGAEAGEIGYATGRNIGTGGLLLGIGIAVAVVVVVVLRLIQPGLGDFLSDYPWSIPAFMPPAILLVGGLVYWMFAGRKAKPNE